MKTRNNAKKGTCRKIPTQIMTCQEEDIVLHNGRLVYVNQIVKSGHERRGNDAGERDSITVCAILENGQILTRSPRFIDMDWEHPPKRERREVKKGKKPISGYISSLDNKTYQVFGHLGAKGGAE